MMTHWPQLLVLMDIALMFALHCANVGRSRPWNPTLYAIDAAITLSVLYAGGFFVPLGWGSP